MKAKSYYIYAVTAAALSTLLTLARNLISSFAIICIIAAVFVIAGALTLIAGARVRTHKAARVLTLICSIAAVVGGVLLLVFNSEVATILPTVMSIAVAAAALWQTLVILRQPISEAKHSRWMLISPAALIVIASYLWLLQPHSDPQAMTAMAVAAAIIAISTVIEAFILRAAPQTTQNHPLTPLDGQNNP
ncbi:MAG: hypothetical protein ACI4AM_09060 [Muribaculaceae bacterium]